MSDTGQEQALSQEEIQTLARYFELLAKIEKSLEESAK